MISKVVQFLFGRKINIWVLLEVLIKRGGASLLGAYYQKIRKSHVLAASRPAPDLLRGNQIILRVWTDRHASSFSPLGRVAEI